MKPDNFFEEMTRITKAHAYDIVSAQVSDLKDQNAILKKAIRDIMDEIINMNKDEIISNPSLFVGRVSKICRETLKLRPL